MKLIDILVRDLPKRGGWPDKCEKISQDKSGKVHAFWCNEEINYSEAFGEWTIKRGDYSQVIFPVTPELSDDFRKSLITREQYEAALAASIAQREPVAEWIDIDKCDGGRMIDEWDGLGLPPAGCECEFSWAGAEWKQGIISFVSKKYVIIEDAEVEHSYEITGTTFRPLRTEVDKKRDYEVSEMMHVGLSLPAAIPFTREEMQALYDAGYRKVEQ